MSYECAGGSLKLKGVSDKAIKKKKKKSKSSELKVYFKLLKKNKQTYKSII